MNKQLQGRVFDIPDDILKRLNSMYTSLNGEHIDGVERCKKLLTDKKVNYGQLKRIIHDLQYMDKIEEDKKYNLAGGELMLKWGKNLLDNERRFIKNKKMGSKNADEISGLTGIRKNNFNKTHKQKDNYKTSTNILKNKTDNSYVGQLKSPGLFEELIKIKKLISY